MKRTAEEMERYDLKGNAVNHLKITMKEAV